jgi:hypothetical protein
MSTSHRYCVRVAVEKTLIVFADSPDDAKLVAIEHHSELPAKINDRVTCTVLTVEEDKHPIPVF